MKRTAPNEETEVLAKDEARQASHGFTWRVLGISVVLIAVAFGLSLLVFDDTETDIGTTSSTTSGENAPVVEPAADQPVVDPAPEEPAAPAND